MSLEKALIAQARSSILESKQINHFSPGMKSDPNSEAATNEVNSGFVLKHNGEGPPISARVNAKILNILGSFCLQNLIKPPNNVSK